MEAYVVPAVIFAVLLGLVELAKILARQLGTQKNGNGHEIARMAHNECREKMTRVESTVEKLDRKFDLFAQSCDRSLNQIDLDLRDMQAVLRTRETTSPGIIRPRFDDE